MKYLTPADRLAAHSVYMPATQCWLWIGSVQANGRPRITVRVNGAVKRMLCTQYVIRYVREQRATRRTVGMHSCDNPACVAPDHITRGTQLQNMRDMRAKQWARQTLRDATVRYV